jgi:hypothetical protein
MKITENLLKAIKSITLEASHQFAEQLREIEDLLAVKNYQLVSQTIHSPRTLNQNWNLGDFLKNS